MKDFDSRLHAARDDLADQRLEGLVKAKQFVAARRVQVSAALTSVRKWPVPDATQLTQALMGDDAAVFENRDGWSWIQLDRDGYVGYVESTSLTPSPTAATHRVAVPLTFLYPEANLKSQPHTPVALNAHLTVVGESGRFLRLADGRHVFSGHVKPVNTYEHDFVAVAEWFRGVPYLWGGKSVAGLDCSGLVQVALEACGRPAPRDSDMQEQTLGTRLPTADFGDLQRGDLVFWNGHVGIMLDSDTLLHANGHHMMVAAEPLRAAAGRIAQVYGAITSIRRLQ